jgi:uncharacterized membrane protein
MMVLMLLDHTRLYFHSDSQHIDPTNLSQTNAALFLTRWITHIVAPVFVFLAGTGTYLQISRGKNRNELSRFLLTRGLLLILLEFTIVRLGLTFHLDYGSFFGSMQVIWAIGVSMTALAGLIYLPLPIIAGFGVAMIASHNLLDSIRVIPWKGAGSPVPGLFDVLWLLLHQPGRFLVCGYPCPSVFVLYPLIPWIGVMAAGFTFGIIYEMDPKWRRWSLFCLGLALMLAFVVIRWNNAYGDPNPWEVQTNSLFTIFSFLNATKYPVSLLFLLMTLGPAMILLAWLERIKQGPLSKALITFGRVPLFFYLLQFYVAHGLAIIVGSLAGQPITYQYKPNTKAPDGVGFDLWVVYLFWIVGLILLYPLCRWFAGIKDRHRKQWLRYL